MGERTSIRSMVRHTDVESTHLVGIIISHDYYGWLIEDTVGGVKVGVPLDWCLRQYVGKRIRIMIEMDDSNA